MIMSTLWVTMIISSGSFISRISSHALASFVAATAGVFDLSDYICRLGLAHGLKTSLGEFQVGSVVSGLC